MSLPKVAVLMGSDSDWDIMETSVKTLKEFGIDSEVHVLSAHRTPDLVSTFASEAVSNGFGVMIAGAGGAAHLAGVIAAHTILPVIGVPINATSLGGFDALLATVQMPAGIPVATVAVGKPGARNAGILAAQILGVADAGMKKKLISFKSDMAEKVQAKDKKIQERLKA